MDNQLYIDVRNRMQSLLARPDVEALMSSAQDEIKREEQTSKVQASTDANQWNEEEEKKQPIGPGGAGANVPFTIDDDEDEEEEKKAEEE